MNRYVVDGLLADMRKGKRVLYLGPDLDEARKLLAQLEPLLLPGETKRRPYHTWHVESPSGGCIRLKSVGSSVRGIQTDVVVVDGDPTIRQTEELRPLLDRAEMVRL